MSQLLDQPKQQIAINSAILFYCCAMTIRVLAFTQFLPFLPFYPSAAPEFTPRFQWGSCYSIFSFMCMFCRSLFVLLSFFFWPLCGLFFDLRILITPLVSSNSSFTTFSTNVSKFYLLYVSSINISNKKRRYQYRITDYWAKGVIVHQQRYRPSYSNTTQV